MGGRQYHPKTATTTTRSLSLVLAFSSLLLIALSILYFISSSSSSLPSSTSSSSSFFSSSPVHSSQPPDYSFVASLKKFLKANPPDAVSADDNFHDVNKLDDSIWNIETQRLFQQFNSPSPFPLRVYVYQMPSKFTYDLLRLFIDNYTDTSNLTSNGSPVHRLIEQHSIDYWLWADLIAPDSHRLLNHVVVRVPNQQDADLFYIPFFTTISFFLLDKQPCKALYRV